MLAHVFLSAYCNETGELTSDLLFINQIKGFSYSLFYQRIFFFSILSKDYLFILHLNFILTLLRVSFQENETN